MFEGCIMIGREPRWAMVVNLQDPGIDWQRQRHWNIMRHDDLAHSGVSQQTRNQLFHHRAMGMANN